MKIKHFWVDDPDANGRLSINVPHGSRLIDIVSDSSTGLNSFVFLVTDDDQLIERKFLVLRTGQEVSHYRHYYGRYTNDMGAEYFVFEGGMVGV